jgi:hypothetical protein
MDPIEEFAAFEGKAYSASTRRVYLSAAKKALKLLGIAGDKCGSYEELSCLLREALANETLPKTLRIGAFLSFLQSKNPGVRVGEPDYGPVRTWILDRIERETKAVREASHYVRRDLALLACLCLAPGKGVPPRWPKSALTVAREKGGGFKVKLWDKEVEAGGLALTLLYWHTWRERLDRPEQRRMYRKGWAYSDLLFPASNGGPLTKHAVRNALLRLTAGGDGPAGVTPGVIRKAFIQLEELDLRAARLGLGEGRELKKAPPFQ